MGFLECALRIRAGNFMRDYITPHTIMQLYDLPLCGRPRPEVGIQRPVPIRRTSGLPCVAQRAKKGPAFVVNYGGRASCATEDDIF